MTPMDFDPAAFDERDGTLCTGWQQPSAGAINLSFASAAPQSNRQYTSSQYGTTLHSNPPMNVASNPFSATSTSAFDFGSLNNQLHASGSTAQQPLNHHASQQFSQHNPYTPSTEYPRSFNDGYTAPQHSMTSSRYGNHATFQNFYDPGLSTTLGYTYDGPSNGYITSASENGRPSISTAQTQDFGSPISGTSSNYFPTSSNGLTQQSAQSLQPPQFERRYSAPFLEVPNQVLGSFNCMHCGHTSRTASEHK